MDYKVGDLIIDDDDGATGFIFEILSELILPNDDVIKGPIYKVHWFSGLSDFSDPVSTETPEGIKNYRRLQ